MEQSGTGMSAAPYLWFAPAGLAALVAIQTPPARRLPFLPLLAGPLYMSLAAAPAALWEYSWSYIWGLFTVIWFTHITYLLYVERYEVPSLRAAPAAKKDDGDGGGDKDGAAAAAAPRRTWDWHGAYKAWMDFRGLVVNAKPMSGVRAGRPSSRLAFLLRRLLSLLAIFVALDLTPLLLFPGPFHPLTLDDYAPRKTVFLRRVLFAQGTADAVTPREAQLRALFAVIWAWAPALQLVALHDALALVFVVVLRLDAPHEWPPFYGPLGAAVSLRAFWSRFWHRAVVRCYTGYAGLLSRRALRLRPRAPADRFAVHLLTFALSGAVHSVVSAAFGHPCAKWRDWAWYAAQFPAILVEDRLLAAVGAAVGAAVKALGLKPGEGVGGRVVRGATVAAGLAYMYAWFFWSVPKWYYPKAWCLPPDA